MSKQKRQITVPWPTLAIDPSTKYIGWAFGAITGPVVQYRAAERLKVRGDHIVHRLKAVYTQTLALVHKTIGECWEEFDLRAATGFTIIIERPSQHTHSHVYKDAQGKTRPQKTVSGLGTYGVAVGMAWGAAIAAQQDLQFNQRAPVYIITYEANEWTAKLPSPWRAKKQHGLAAERVWPEYAQFRKRGDCGRDIADAVLLLNHHARESHRIRCREDIECRAAEREKNARRSQSRRG